MLRGHEGRKFILDAEKLVQRVIVVCVLFALGLQGQEIFEHVVIQGVSLVHAGTVVSAQRFQIGAQFFLQFLFLSQTLVGQIVAVPIHPAGQHAHRAHHLRILETVLHEYPVIEPVRLDGLEPNAVNQQQSHGGEQQQE